MALETRPSADHTIAAEVVEHSDAATRAEIPRGGFLRPDCHWLSARMSAAAAPISLAANPIAEAPPVEATEPQAAPPEQSALAENDAERAAAIETLVALAATIDPARGAAFSAPGESAFGVPPRTGTSTPSFVYDPPRTAIDTAPAQPPAADEDEFADEPPIPYDPASSDEKPRWFDVLRSYPDAGLLLVAVSLIGIWAYTSAPRTVEPVYGPPVAKITSDEARPSPSPRSETARLRFLGEGCSASSCAALLTPPVEPGPSSETVAHYTPAGEPADGTTDTTVVTAAAPPVPPSPENEPVEITAEAMAEIPLATTPLAATSIPQEPIPAGTPEAPAPTPIAGPSQQQDLASAPLTVEPGSSGDPAPLAATATVAPIPASSPALPLSAVEPKPVDVAEIPTGTAAVEALTPPPHVVGSIPPKKALSSTAKRQAAAPPLAQAAPFSRKADKPKAAKKATAPAAAKAATKPAAPAKVAARKPAAPKPGAAQDAAAGKDQAGKAPGFPSPAPPTALFKPASPPPAAALASKAPAPVSPEPAPRAGDMPPGFEIQTSIGGGFFALQPY